MKLTLLIIFIVLTIAGGGLLYARDFATDIDHEVRPVTVRLKWLHQAQFAGMYVADAKGYYRDRGLQVSLLESDPKVNAIDELLEGKADLAIVSANQLFFAHEAKKDIKAVAAIYQHSPSAIVALEASNITAPKDLKNKKLGITTDSVEARLIYNVLLTDSHVDPSTVSYEVSGFGQLAPLLTSKVDAVSLYRTSGLYTLNDLGEKYTLILPETYGFERYDDVIVASSEYLRNNGETVHKFLDATFEGWEYAFEHIDEAAVLSRQKSSSQFFDLNFHTFVLEQSKPLIQAESVFRIGDMDYMRWKKSYDYLRQYDLIGNIDVQDIYTIDYLK